MRYTSFLDSPIWNVQKSNIFIALYFLKAQTKVRKKVMGVLDIYGFEIFEVRPL